MSESVAFGRPYLHRLVFAAILAGGVVRVVSTYHVFNQTWDEPFHLAAGMEWLGSGKYAYEPLHPPLARIAIAVGPYLAGARPGGGPSMLIEGNRLLATDGAYDRNLALARLGILPFFIVTVVAVFAWARALFGETIGVVAAFLVSSLPPMLAHAGVATTDMALTAFVTLSLLAFTRWLSRPTMGRSCWVGTAAGLAILSKLSALLFLPVGALAVALAAWRGGRDRAYRMRLGRRAALQNAIGALVACLVVVWAGYRFSVGPILPLSRPPGPVGWVPLTWVTPGRFMHRLAEEPVFPAPQLAQGLVQLRSRLHEPMHTFVLGTLSSSGRWYFFPVALGVKTPVAFLLLTLVGLLALARHDAERPRWDAAAPPLAAAAILLVCLPASLDIGIRHVLPIYPLLAVTASGGVAALWTFRHARYPRMGPALACVLAAWFLVASLRAHPDYLAYFNELIIGPSDRVLVDSDLDWGQDLKRLAQAARRMGIDTLTIAYAGSAELSAAGLPPLRQLEPHHPVDGWIALSVNSLRLGLSRSIKADDEHWSSWLRTDSPDSYTWLEEYQPVAYIGYSIRLYRVQRGDVPAPPVP